MVAVAKRTNKSVDPAPESLDEGRGRIGVNLNVWLPDELMAAFEALRKKTRRTKTAEVMVMMEEYLASKKLWPPAGSEGAPVVEGNARGRGQAGR